MCIGISLKSGYRFINNRYASVCSKDGDQYQNVLHPDMKNIGTSHFRQYAFSCATLQNLSQMATNAKPSRNPDGNEMFALSAYFAT